MKLLAEEEGKFDEDGSSGEEGEDDMRQEADGSYTLFSVDKYKIGGKNTTINQDAYFKNIMKYKPKVSLYDTKDNIYPKFFQKPRTEIRRLFNK